MEIGLIKFSKPATYNGRRQIDVEFYSSTGERMYSFQRGNEDLPDIKIEQEYKGSPTYLVFEERCTGDKFGNTEVILLARGLPLTSAKKFTANHLTTQSR